MKRNQRLGQSSVKECPRFLECRENHGDKTKQAGMENSSSPGSSHAHRQRKALAELCPSEHGKHCRSIAGRACTVELCGRSFWYLTFHEHWSLWRLTSCIFNKSYHFRMLTAVLAVCMLDVWSSHSQLCTQYSLHLKSSEMILIHHDALTIENAHMTHRGLRNLNGCTV